MPDPLSGIHTLCGQHYRRIRRRAVETNTRASWVALNSRLFHEPIQHALLTRPVEFDRKLVAFDG